MMVNGDIDNDNNIDHNDRNDSTMHHDQDKQWTMIQL